MPKAIVAIGGGVIKTRGTAAIDREIIRLSHKKNPKLLFIPTASSDSEIYWNRIREYFGKFLKCKTDVLFLVKEQPSKEQIRSKISAADIIYVGGGNTLMMMRLWRRLGVDKLLISAYENGTVLSGISAGSICWFDSGHSDSMSFYNPRKWNPRNPSAKALPGHDSEDRGHRNRDREQLRDRVHRWPALQSHQLKKPCKGLQGLQKWRRIGRRADKPAETTGACRIPQSSLPARVTGICVGHG
jgi:peptidase E